jgi:hypothetical protein
MLPVSKLDAARLRGLITTVLASEAYRKQALGMKEAIRKAGGVVRAVDISSLALIIKKWYSAKMPPQFGLQYGRCPGHECRSGKLRICAE